MTKAKAFIIGALLLLFPAMAFGYGAIEPLSKWFVNGLTAGSLEQLSINSSGEITQTASSNLATTSVDAFTEGGSQGSTSTVTAVFGTLTEAQLLYNSVLTFTPNILAATTTLPATSTWTSLLPSTGDSRSWLLRNGTTTASRWVGIAAGSGIDIQAPTALNVQIPTNGTAEMRCTRLSTRDVVCRIDTHVAAD